ncbi:anthrone oxygenase family protein [Streptomyces longwoodensis]|uniref:anthrone oxygenase family protein n=1 Tax=Streptomyces longwoodensis TaxID=68231 RepID=UPI0036E5D504
MSEETSTPTHTTTPTPRARGTATTRTGGTTGTRAGTAAGGVLLAGTVAAGLVAGIYYAFACAVMPALARGDDRTYVEVMRAVNDVIQNPVFFTAFFGAPLLTGVSAWRLRGTEGRGWIWAGFLACALAFLVTVACNVPLNDALTRPGAPHTLRERFEDPWVAWNAVRTVVSTVAVGCLGRGLWVVGRRP